METLRQSVEQLVAPICEACDLEMTWSRSALVAAEQAIHHVFACPRCNGIGQVVTPVKVPKE
jgi:hypothetical protein